MRDDMSYNLVHLTKGEGESADQDRREASFRLQNILLQGKLVGGTGYIRGSFRCVCFSEAPISKISQMLATRQANGVKYQPYGIMIPKRWLFSKGGLPVVYGPDSQYEELPESMRYRHVKLELATPPYSDFSWEREWRIHTDELLIWQNNVTVIVPSRHAKSYFQRNGFSAWHYMCLDDFGIDTRSR